jgi:hypothetical protein
MSAGDDWLELELFVHGRIPSAWHLSATGSWSQARWIARSTVQMERGAMVGKRYKVKLPQQLARLKGFIISDEMELEA